MWIRALLAVSAAVAVTTAGSGYLGRAIGDWSLTRVARVERNEPTVQTRYFVRDMGMEVGLIAGGVGAVSGLAVGVGTWLLLGRHTVYVTVTRERYTLFKRWCDAIQSGDLVTQMAIEAQLKEGRHARTLR